MTRMLEAIPEFPQATSAVRFTVNAWTADNVFIDGDDGLAYPVERDSIRVNPARLLTEPEAVIERLEALDPAWQRDEIRQAVIEARTRLRNHFHVRRSADEVMIELQGRRLRIRPETWRDAVADLAARGMPPRVLRDELLDHARLTLANSIAAFEWF